MKRAKQRKSTRSQIKRFKSDESIELDDLPEEVLIHILDFLYTPDKKIASLVCTKWNNLIMQEPRLAKDMIYRFSNVRFRPNIPPYSVFMNTTRSFYHVQLNEIAVAPNEFKEICVKIGTNTRILEHDQTSSQFLVAEWFPKVERLVINNLNNLVDMADLPQSIREIHTGFVDSHVDTRIGEILHSLPSLEVLSTRAVIKHGKAPNKDLELVKLADALNVIENPLYLKKSTNLWKLTELQPQHLSVRFEDKIINNPMLLENCYKLRKLPDTQECWFVHRDLPQLRNLRSFNLSATRPCGDCMEFFIRTCPNVTKFQLSISNVSYFRHILAAFKSFETLKIESKSPYQLSSIFGKPSYHYKFRKLKCMSINCLGFQNRPVDWTEWPRMPSLESLTIKPSARNEKVLEGIEAIVRKCPNIRCFVLHATSYLTLNQIQVMLQKWPYLTTLDVVVDTHSFDTRRMTQLLQEHCKEIREVRFRAAFTQGQVMKPHDKIMRNLFLQVPTLRRASVHWVDDFTYFNFQDRCM